MPVLRRTDGRDRKTDGSATPTAISADPTHNSGMIKVAAVHHEIQCCYGSTVGCVSTDVHLESPNADPLRHSRASAIHVGRAMASLDIISILRNTG